MNGKNVEIKTEFWSVGLEDLEAIKTELEIWTIKSRTFAKRIERIAEKIDKTSEYEVEELLFDICAFFGDCKICPLRYNCKVVTDACNEVFNCETCPRIRLCVRDKVAGLKEYLEEGDEE